MWRADIEVPISAVYVNYWALSACYPQGNFYPLSDGNSIFYRQITMSCFRTCSTCRSRSQAPLYHYTLWLISKQSEGTFERLRYFLGGDRPSQTARLTVSPDRFHGRRLETQQSKGGIPRVTPECLTTLFLRLPPILYMDYRISVLSCSKAPWGLSV